MLQQQLTPKLELAQNLNSNQLENSPSPSLPDKKQTLNKHTKQQQQQQTTFYPGVNQVTQYPRMDKTPPPPPPHPEVG